jgi:Domain of unknown function (DUF4381)
MSLPLLQTPPLTMGSPAAEDIRPPKPLIEIPQPPAPFPWQWWIAGGVVLILIIGLLIWLLKKRKRKPEASAIERAKSALDRIETQGANLSSEGFATACSQVVRSFIEECFQVAAPKRTTEEFLSLIQTHPALLHRKDALLAFLKSCDKAKFAASDLASLERTELMARAHEFVSHQPSQPPPLPLND